MAQAGIDTAVIAFANAMRVKSIIGSTSLIVSKRDVQAADAAAKWKSEYDGAARGASGALPWGYVARLRARLPVASKALAVIIPALYRFCRPMLSRCQSRAQSSAILTGSLSWFGGMPTILTDQYFDFLSHHAIDGVPDLQVEGGGSLT